MTKIDIVPNSCYVE